MKKIITSWLAFIICLPICTFTSCKEDPVDRQLDDIEMIMAKVHKLAHEANPSREEIMDFKAGAMALQKSLSAFQQSLAFMPNAKDDQLTESQKKRFIEIIQKSQSMYYDQDFQRFQQLTKQYNLNY